MKTSVGQIETSSRPARRCVVFGLSISSQSSCPALALAPLKTNYITIAVITFPDMTILPCGGDITLLGSWIARITIINSEAHPAPSASHRLFLIGLNSQRAKNRAVTRNSFQDSITLLITCLCWMCSEMTKVAMLTRDKQQKQHSQYRKRQEQ